MQHGWHLYESCGQSVFNIYGLTGAPETRVMSWLIRERDGKCEALPVEFSTPEGAAIGFDEAGFEQYVAGKIQDAIRTGNPQEVNLDGGALPMPNEKQNF